MRFLIQRRNVVVAAGLLSFSAAVAGLMVLLAGLADGTQCTAGEGWRECGPEDLHRLGVHGAVTLVLDQADTGGVRIEGPEAFLRGLPVTVQGGAATIGDEDTDEDTDYTVRATFQRLERLDLAGQVAITTTAPLEGDDVRLAASGNTQGELILRASSLTAYTSGGTDLTVRQPSDANGATPAASAEVKSSGSINLDLGDFPVQRVSVATSGNSALRLNVVDSLEAEASGNLVVRYAGRPALRFTGTGRVMLVPE